VNAQQTVETGLSGLLTRSDTLQLLMAFLGLLLLAVAITWPTALGPNDSWYTLVQVKASALLLLSVGYGGGVALAPRATQLAALGVPLVFWILGLPFELVTYAASHPEAPLWWSFATRPLGILGFFGVGLAFGRALARARAALPLIPPLMLVGAISFDVWLGRAVLSPAAVAGAVAPAHIGATALLSLVTLVLLARAPARPAGHNEGDAD
jgi:hypothetical protein